MQNDTCCPVFDPAPWDGKVVEWQDKKFIKDKIFTLFYMPVNMGSVMKRITAKAEAVEAMTPEAMCLSEHKSLWNMDVYLAVNKEIPDADNVTLSGKLLCKVYEGDFSKTGEWMKDAEGFAKTKEMKIGRWFMWYTTCPKCAIKYGKNYVVVMGLVD